MGCSDLNVWRLCTVWIFFAPLLIPLIAQNTPTRRCTTNQSTYCKMYLSQNELKNTEKCYGRTQVQHVHCYDLKCETKSIDTDPVKVKCLYMNRMYVNQSCCIQIQSRKECYMIRLQYGKIINEFSPFFPEACDSPTTGTSETSETSSTESLLNQQQGAASLLQDDGNVQENTSPGQPGSKELVDDSETLSALSIGVIVGGVVVCSSILIGFAVWKWNQSRQQDPALLFSRSPNSRKPDTNRGISAWKAPGSTYETPDWRQSSDSSAPYDTLPKDKSTPDETQDQSVYTTVDNESYTAPPGYSTFTRPKKPPPSNGNTNHDYSKLDDPKPSPSFDEIVKESEAEADRVGQKAIKATDLPEADPFDNLTNTYVTLEDEENQSSKTTPDQNYFELEENDNSSPQALLTDNDYFQLEMEHDVQTAHQTDNDKAEHRKEIYFEIEKEDKSTRYGENETNNKIKAQDDITDDSANDRTATYIELEKGESTEDTEEALYQLANAIIQ